MPGSPPTARQLRPKYNRVFNLEAEQIGTLHPQLAVFDWEVLLHELDGWVVASYGRDARQLVKRLVADRIRQQFDELAGRLECSCF
jgi:hypothetical protein